MFFGFGFVGLYRRWRGDRFSAIVAAIATITGG
jgi:hypothetical protein